MTDLSVHYQIAMPEPATHLFHVEITLRGLTTATCRFLMPVWTPGSYLVREFARHVQDFKALDGEGRLLACCKTAKDCWQVEAAGSAGVTVRYRVYANELTVRTSHLDTSHGYFNGANVFMVPEGARHLALELTIVPPAGWTVSTPLDPLPGEENRFRAVDFDHLIDSPTEIGTQQVLAFEVLGKAHRIAFYGHGNEDLPRLVEDVGKIVTHAAAIFGGLPYEHYLFIIHASALRGGGLEHRNSSSNSVTRWSFGDPETYRSQVLGLLAHEFFHTWNVKRVRPESFMPYDLQTETYTRLLWVMEGWTSYYELIVLRRADLISAEQFLAEVARRILQLRQTPGRLVQSLEMASFDTWIKFYRPDENTQNTAISYYLKGALLALLLDLEIREGTSDERSLDDVLRVLWTDYTQTGRGISEDRFQAIVESVAGRSLDDFFARYVRGVDELPFDAYLARVGLALRLGYEEDQKAGEALSGNAAPKAGLGVRVEESSGRTLLNAVFSDGACYRADVAAGDELLALDGFRVSEATLGPRLAGYRPGDRVSLTLFRRDELRQVDVVLGERPYTHAEIQPLAAASADPRARFEAWLGEPFPGPTFHAGASQELAAERPKT